MGAWRWFVVGVGACSGSSATSVPDSGPSPDAQPVVCTRSLPFTGGQGLDLALHGTTMSAYDGTMHALQALTPDGAETTLLTSPDPIPLATRDSVAFYGRKQAAGYDIFAHGEPQDTHLGTVPATSPPALGATVTDVYVLAPDGAGASRAVAARLSRSRASPGRQRDCMSATRSPRFA